MTLEGNNNDLQYEGLTPQVQVLGYNAGLLSPERAFLCAHATRCAKCCNDSCCDRCNQLSTQKALGSAALLRKEPSLLCDRSIFLKNKPSLTLFKGKVTDVNGKIAIFAPYNLRRSNFSVNIIFNFKTI